MCKTAASLHPTSPNKPDCFIHVRSVQGYNRSTHQGTRPEVWFEGGDRGYKTGPSIWTCIPVLASFIHWPIHAITCSHSSPSTTAFTKSSLALYAWSPTYTRMVIKLEIYLQFLFTKGGWMESMIRDGSGRGKKTKIPQHKTKNWTKLRPFGYPLSHI